MRRLIWPVLFLLLLLLQGSVSVFYHGWLSCDMAYVALYAYALQRGSTSGAAAGFVIGFLQDALQVNVFGYHIISRTVMGYIVGLLKGKVVKDRMAYHIMAISLCSLASRLFLFIIELLRNGSNWNIIGIFWWNAIGFIIGNMLITVPVVYLVKRAYDWIREEEIMY